MKCIKCGKPISMHLKGYCMACRYEMKMEKRSCQWCGAQFSSRDYRHKFCTDECYKKHKAKKERERTYTLICRECGEQFTATHHDKKFCSSQCRRNGYTGYKSHYKVMPKPKIRPVPAIIRPRNPGIVPPIEGWNSGIIPVRPQGGGRATLKCNPARLPDRGKPTAEYRELPPPFPSVQTRVIGNQWPPGKWERY